MKNLEKTKVFSKEPYNAGYLDASFRFSIQALSYRPQIIIKGIS